LLIIVVNAISIHWRFRLIRHSVIAYESGYENGVVYWAEMGTAIC